MKWAHIISDSIIAFGFLVISVCLIIVWRQRHGNSDFQIPFPNFFVVFSVFAGMCALNYITDALMFWKPYYVMSVWDLIARVFVATLSFATVITLLLQLRAIICKGMEKKAIEKLEQENKELEEETQAKDEFIAMLSHELRNPLTPLRGAISLLSSKDCQSQDEEEACKIADRQMNHMVRLIDDLLEMSRIIQGKVKLEKQTTNLTVVVTNAVESIRDDIQRKEQEITVKIPRKPVLVWGDEVRLAQVFYNLLSNASKYTENRGKVHVIMSVGRDWVTTHVYDNGIGIPEESQKRIFGLFEQENTTLDRIDGGLGIGLTLANRLVQNHNGTISVDSQVGKGSHFSVELPLK